jgi:hypothetical protein
MANTNYDPATATPSQVTTFADLPATTSPIRADYLQHIHTVLGDWLGATGRGPGMVAGQYPRSGGYISVASTVNPSTAALSNSSMRATYIDLAAAGTAVGIGIEVTTLQSGGLGRLGIYATSLTTGLPSTLILDAGTVDCSSTGFKEITISQALNPGRYWLAYVSQSSGTAPTVRVMGAPTMGIPTMAQSDLTSVPAALQQSSVTGALPNPFVASATGSLVARVYLKF